LTTRQKASSPIGELCALQKLDVLREEPLHDLGLLRRRLAPRGVPPFAKRVIGSGEGSRPHRSDSCDGQVRGAARIGGKPASAPEKSGEPKITPRRHERQRSQGIPISATGRAGRGLRGGLSWTCSEGYHPGRISSDGKQGAGHQREVRQLDGAAQETMGLDRYNARRDCSTLLCARATGEGRRSSAARAPAQADPIGCSAAHPPQGSHPGGSSSASRRAPSA